ncbi:septation ring formation regulator EzrA [Sporosarcina sp. G11-34]|uniref:septation ring formation regulator EzrA n=1 Tax=Sporosarcina sp. G11-34 TaxID=2849605 RepID=UPI0022A8E0DE|nr:septation ring formation regulator EzrA [Sporosarcina sp. G11-34]MCZ2257964.1 septation ring formation regulator EzrA [Sporosarcina sp. G11-34]
MLYIVTALIVLLIITIIVFSYRRKHISEIGRLEQEKLQIQNRPILEEMTKIKQLNMTGETEKKFERWRSEWTEVMDVHLPGIDTLLFDAEDVIGRLRFKKATQIESEIREKTHFCDTKMNDILQELNELVGSEEKNRIEMEKLQDEHRAARKTILAYQHSFGMTAEPLEKELELFNPKFAEYEELTSNGNYLQAREVVIYLSEKGEHVFSLIDEIPSLLTELQNKIPSSIRNLRNGIMEMEDQFYYLHHLQLTEHLDGIEEEIQDMLSEMTELQMESIQQRTNEINIRIDSFYDALENEVHAKRYVDDHYEYTFEKLSSIRLLTRETSDEAAFVQQSYRMNDEEAQIPIDAMKKLDALSKRFEVLSLRVENNESAYSSLEDELRRMNEELDLIAEEQEEFARRMKNLRIDENSVRIKLEELAKKLQNTERKLYKGNIPGIPDEVDARLEEAEEQIYVVTQSLQEVPLNMNLVNSYLENAEKSVADVTEKVEELLENVMLIEWIIQYGNRYRATNPAMHARLLEAEESFRQFRYAKALEEAATAVEEVEPGAMKKIEEFAHENV